MPSLRMIPGSALSFDLSVEDLFELLDFRFGKSVVAHKTGEKGRDLAVEHAFQK
jgi:hypothetical protein